MTERLDAAVAATALRWQTRKTEGSWNLHCAVTDLWLGDAETPTLVYDDAALWRTKTEVQDFVRLFDKHSTPKELLAPFEFEMELPDEPIAGRAA